MKNLELNQMEELQGGSCEVAVASYFAAIVIGALSGPFGWAVVASITVASIGVVDGCIAE